MGNNRFQLLLSTVDQTDYSILDERNINCSAVVVNQADSFSKDVFMHKGKEVVWLNFPERGVGLSRNLALLHATAEIVLFADDDITYSDSIEADVLKEFDSAEQSDAIVFNLAADGESLRRPKQNHSRNRLNRFNCVRYGAPRFAARLDSLRKTRVAFSLLFGGGAPFNSGEDSLFILDCVKRGMKVYTSPIAVGTVSFEKSSWFTGFDDKYFADKGASYRAIAGAFAPVYMGQFLLKHSEFWKHEGLARAFKLMMRGARNYDLFGFN